MDNCGWYKSLFKQLVYATGFNTVPVYVYTLDTDQNKYVTTTGTINTDQNKYVTTTGTTNTDQNNMLRQQEQYTLIDFTNKQLKYKKVYLMQIYLLEREKCISHLK